MLATQKRQSMESLIQEKLGKKTPACNQLSCYWNRGAETNMSTHTCTTNIWVTIGSLTHEQALISCGE